ncbi:hypothetical protein GGR54DRAFT_423034 [Hypoxylon sp. NC1633]|nr:hypothetical protein GGR54DRAFT_423034 [Hypoxylon sp. NC1633]
MSSILLPFLYQTRTILRANPRRTAAFARSLHATCRHLRRSDDIPFISELGGEETPSGQISSEPVRRGTITPAERQVFERIFADIKARGLKPTIQEDAPSHPAAEARPTLLIMQQAAQDASQARPAQATSPNAHRVAAQDRNRALLRFPPDLRAAASKALGAIEASPMAVEDRDYIAYDEASIAASQWDDDGWKSPASSTDRTTELEAQRQPERARVEGLLAAAKTDFELWDVLEKEVFTMPAKLGLDRRASPTDGTESTEPATRRRGRKKKTTTEETTNISEVRNVGVANDAEASEIAPRETDAEAPKSHALPQKLSLYVHGPLYPAYLLLALRRLNTAFHAPSLLAFSLLPRIKELGLESYVLGVSTPFYNELLDIYWTNRGDLSSMLDLLEEMRHCGLSFDRQTASILDRADSMLTTLASKGSPSSFGRIIMTMPEYERAVRDRIKQWIRVVDLSIEEEHLGY